MATMFLCFSFVRIATLLSSLFLYFWVIRCSLGATYTAAFSFAVLCQLFTFSVSWDGTEVFSDRIMLFVFFYDAFLITTAPDMIFEVLCLLLKVTCCDVGSAEVIST